MNFRLLSSTHVINLLLMAVCVVGLCFLIPEQSQLSQPRLEYERLTKRYGVLDAGDETEFVVVNVPSDSPYVFIWRIFCPANLRVPIQIASADNPRAFSGSTSNNDAKEIRYSVSFKFIEGHCQTYVRGMGHSGTNGFGSKQMNRFLESHWEQLNFEVLGSTGPIRLGADELVPLFKIEIPESLQDELESEVDEVYREGFQKNPVFQIRFGAPTAPAAQKGGTNP